MTAVIPFVPVPLPLYLPTGSYVIADPCYAEVWRDRWSELCRTIFHDSIDGYGAFTYGEHLIVWSSTAHGDGAYPVWDTLRSTIVGEFGVDAGLFAIIPAVLVPELAHAVEIPAQYPLRIGIGPSHGDMTLDSIAVCYVIDTSGDTEDELSTQTMLTTLDDDYDDEYEDEDEDEDEESKENEDRCHCGH